jgi:general stress protein 26
MTRRAEMASWSEFAADRPDFAEAGARLFRQFSVALLATSAEDGGPRMAPVCPILAGEHLYLIVARHTPKLRQLQRDPRYALHAFLGPNDEEFQVRGTAELVTSEAERAAARSTVACGATGNASASPTRKPFGNAGQPRTARSRPSEPIGLRSVPAGGLLGMERHATRAGAPSADGFAEPSGSRRDRGG